MPDFKEAIRKQLAKLRLPPTRESEIVEELSQHLEDQYEQSLSRGASEEDAYQGTLRGLAENDLLARELNRVERRVVQEPVPLGNEKANLLTDLGQDLRYGVRMRMRRWASSVALWKSSGSSWRAIRMPTSLLLAWLKSKRLRLVTRQRSSLR